MCEVATTTTRHALPRNPLLPPSHSAAPANAMAVSPEGEALLLRFKESASEEAELKEAVMAEFAMLGQNEMRALETRASSSPLEEVTL